MKTSETYTPPGAKSWGVIFLSLKGTSEKGTPKKALLKKALLKKVFLKKTLLKKAIGSNNSI